MDKNNLNLFFPYSNVREIQDKLIKKIDEAIKNKKKFIVHAPTGLGKTVAALGPALKYALDNDLVVFFLTSRHTQHLIAIQTLKEIKEKHSLDFSATDIIGKKWMCIQPGANILYPNEFTEFCKNLREESKCEFYSRARDKNKISIEAKTLIEELKQLSPLDTEKVINFCRDKNLCPYEISALLAKDSKVIISDYYYLFNPNIRDSFLGRMQKTPEQIIAIIDEGHNLPNRLRELMTHKLSNFMLQRAIKEAEKFRYDETSETLNGILDVIKEYGNNLEMGKEELIEKKDFIEKINKLKNYDELIADLEFIADDVREKQKQSSIGGIANFLESWKGSDEGFTRILSKKEIKLKDLVTLSYRCLDPSLITEEIIKNSYSSIIMSGTLTPTEMYKDLLGFPSDALMEEYGSPFPQKNKLALVVPETTTKFTKRNPAQFEKIAKICAEIANEVPGNSAIFFPSYFLRDEVNKFFSNLCKKTTFTENAGLTKEEKTQFLEKFKEYKDDGAVLLGAASGSFAEGIDLPGDLLKCVIVVGLPLQKPDLETQELIKYYDSKFKKGWDYGYIFPAVNKALQSAGRCIRSEKDRGVIVFLDERYAWPNYSRCFPKEWDIKVTKLYTDRIKEFFNEKTENKEKEVIADEDIIDKSKVKEEDIKFYDASELKY